MDKAAVATRKDIEDILNVLGTIMKQFDERFNALEVRTDGIEQRLGNIEQRLEKVEKKVEKIEVRLKKVEARLEKVEADLGKTKRTVGKHTDILNELRIICQHNQADQVLYEQKTARMRLDRHDRILRSIAKHTGYRLLPS